ncbi:MAG: metallophosphoesterase [Alistipes sp.]|nr:metallophosphoesterase [Alistipes sp.]
MNPRYMDWIFNLSALAMLSLAIGLIVLVVALVAMFFGASFKMIFLRGLWFMLFPWLAWLYGTMVERNRFRIKRTEIVSQTLPSSFDGYRVVHISDMHLMSFAGRERALQRAVDKINALEPDLIAFTGDLVTLGPEELDGLQDILSAMTAKDGVYAVLGNHDYSEYRRHDSQQARRESLEVLKRRIREMGWHLLLNENRSIVRGEDKLSVIGVENISGNRSFRTYGDFQQARIGADGAYKILLSHDPSHWRAEVVGKSDVDLTLSGHTHAMQISLLGWSPSSLMYDEYRGLYNQGEQYLYINTGLGQTAVNARFGATPEITLITLKKK